MRLIYNKYVPKFFSLNLHAQRSDVAGRIKFDGVDEASGPSGLAWVGGCLRLQPRGSRGVPGARRLKQAARRTYA